MREDRSGPFSTQFIFNLDDSMFDVMYDKPRKGVFYSGCESVPDVKDIPTALYATCIANKRVGGKGVRFLAVNCHSSPELCAKGGTLAVAVVELEGRFDSERLVLPFVAPCGPFTASKSKLFECAERMFDSVRLVGVASDSGKPIGVALCANDDGKLRCGDFSFVSGMWKYSGPVRASILGPDMSVEGRTHGEMRRGRIVLHGLGTIDASPKADLYGAIDREIRSLAGSTVDEASSRLRSVLGEPDISVECSGGDCPLLVDIGGEAKHSAYIEKILAERLRDGFVFVSPSVLVHDRGIVGPSVFAIVISDDGRRLSMWDLCKEPGNCYREYWRYFADKHFEVGSELYKRAVSGKEVEGIPIAIYGDIEAAYRFTGSKYLGGISKWWRSKADDVIRRAISRTMEARNAQKRRRIMERISELVKLLDQGRIGIEEFAAEMPALTKTLYGWQKGLLIHRKCETRGGEEKCLYRIVPIFFSGDDMWRANVDAPSLIIGEVSRDVPEVIITNEGQIISVAGMEREFKRSENPMYQYGYVEYKRKVKA